LSTKPFGLLDEFAFAPVGGFGLLAVAPFDGRVFFGLLDARGFDFGFDFGFERVFVCAMTVPSSSFSRSVTVA
jgi:hypothetical protein